MFRKEGRATSHPKNGSVRASGPGVPMPPIDSGIEHVEHVGSRVRGLLDELRRGVFGFGMMMDRRHSAAAGKKTVRVVRATTRRLRLRRRCIAFFYEVSFSFTWSVRSVVG